MEKIKSLCLGIHRCATNYSQEGLDMLEEELHSYRQVYERMSEISDTPMALDDSERDYVFSVASCTASMTDQCNTQVKMLRLIQSKRESIIAGFKAQERGTESQVPGFALKMLTQFCTIHKGVNLAVAFDNALKNSGVATGATLRTIDEEEDDEEEDDELPELVEWEVEAILAKQVLDGGAVQYLCRWKNYGPDKDSWEPAAHLANSPDLIRDLEARGSGNRNLQQEEAQEAAVKRVVKRSNSKNERTVYDIAKYLCHQSGKGLKEDQMGEQFLNWGVSSNNMSTSQLKLHASMKPVVGNRYFVVHCNAKRIYPLREVYSRFIKDRGADKSTPGLNSREKRLSAALKDFSTLAQLRTTPSLDIRSRCRSCTWLR